VNTKSPHIPTFFRDGNTGEVNKALEGGRERGGGRGREREIDSLRVTKKKLISSARIR
jgi:hypothetical protein